MLVLVVAVAGYAAAYEPDFANTEVVAVHLTESVYMLRGEGGNMGLSVGADGAFLIDDQYEELDEKIVATISALTEKPVRFLVNTHWHIDHVGANETFGRRGATIVAHDNVRTRMILGQARDESDSLFYPGRPPTAAGALPIITFSDNVTFFWNGDTIHVKHLPAAHTDGDVVVIFKEDNIIHAGDLVFEGRYPYIDVKSGGSINGYIDSLVSLLDLMDADTRIITGHGGVMYKPDVEELLYLVMESRKRVQCLKKQGKSLEQVLKSDLLADFDEDWDHIYLTSERWVSAIYHTLQ